MISKPFLYFGCIARVHGENVPKLVSQILNSMYCLRHFVMCMTGTFPGSQVGSCCNGLHFWKNGMRLIWAPGFLQVTCSTQYLFRFYGCCMVVCQRLVFDSSLITSMLLNE